MTRCRCCNELLKSEEIYINDLTGEYEDFCQACLDVVDDLKDDE